jgi:hypothetical protein
VLLLGTECGTSLTGAGDALSAAGQIKYRNAMYSEYLNYASACYQSRQRTQSGCQIYTKPRLPYKIDSNATCPFDESICQNEFDNFFMDSKYLDSWQDLGINAEPRFQLRVTQHCAPLVTDGYKSTYVNPLDPLKTYMRYSYIPNSTVTNSTRDIANPGVFLVQLKSEFDQFARYFSNSITPDYRTRYVSIHKLIMVLSGILTNISTLCSSVAVNHELDFETNFIQELKRTDAFVALLFLDSTDIISLSKVEDPWFAHTVNASRGLYENIQFDQLKSLYVTDEPATVLGCASQVFYCNPKIEDTQKRCVNYYTALTTHDDFSALWPDPADRTAFNGYLATNNIMIATPDSFYNAPGLHSLLARLTLEGGVQMDVFARDQWKKEMEFLCQASLASFQSNVPQATQNGVWFMNTTLCDNGTDAGLCEKLCRNQVSCPCSQQRLCFSTGNISRLMIPRKFEVPNIIRSTSWAWLSFCSSVSSSCSLQP